MADVLVVLTTAAFMAVCVGYVRWCDSIIGADPASAAEDPGDLDASGASTPMGRAA